MRPGYLGVPRARLGAVGGNRSSSDNSRQSTKFSALWVVRNPPQHARGNLLAENFHREVIFASLRQELGQGKKLSGPMTEGTGGDNTDRRVVLEDAVGGEGVEAIARLQLEQRHAPSTWLRPARK